MASDILIVDDEADIRDLVAGILDDEGFSTRTARDSDSALAEIANRRPHLVFLDIWLQGSKLDGLQLLEQIKKDHADVPVVMISGHAPKADDKDHAAATKVEEGETKPPSSGTNETASTTNDETKIEAATGS